MKKKTVWIPVAMFLALIYGGMLWGFMKPDRQYSDTENRFLTARPEFSLKALFDGSFTKDYEKYITDQFPVRDEWIGLKTGVEALLGKTETKGVWLAREGYLIVNYPASDFETKRAQDNIRFLAEAVKDYSERLGQEHVRVMLVPSASQILTDLLPAFCPRYDQSGYLKAVEEAVGPESCIDMEEVLAAHKEEYIYYRTDHHWTTLGAFYAYEAWAESMGFTPVADSCLKVVSQDFLGTTWSRLHGMGRADEISVYDTDMEVTRIRNLTEREEGFYNWEALKTRDQYAVFLGGNDGIVELEPGDKESGQDPERVLLVVKDSFANCLIPYAAGHYDRVVVADLRYLNMSLKAVAEKYGVTDLLVLYHAQAFATEATVFKIAR
ncbi:MAG: hypothetical protein HFI38_08435 [Lachnospiraceae bacterium]|jgi:hypothetical protein|nr:hypothetical protein [Lachnospiraceae bacterium]